MTKLTLNEVATYFDDVATIHTSTGHIDAVDKAVAYAAAVREAIVQRDKDKFHIADLGRTLDDKDAKIATLKAENERLRKLCEPVRDYGNDMEPDEYPRRN